MKIAMISGEYPPMPGGVGDFTRILSQHLRAHGHEVALLSRAGASSESLPLYTVGGWGPKSLHQIRALLRRVKPDVVNLQFQTAAFNMSPFIHFLPKLVSAPVVTTFHDLRFPYLFPKAGPLRNWIVKHLAYSSAGVITTNHEDELRLPALPKRSLIPIGSNIKCRVLNAQERAACRERLGATDETFLLGHFGFVKAIKGLDYLIDALARVRRAGNDLRLVFIGGRSNTVDGGEDDEYLRELDKRINELGLAPALHWTGYLPEADVAACLNSIDLMVLPFADGASYRRGSLIAAVNQGCAILTTEPAVDVEDFAHARNLWLAPPRSAASIESALARLMSNREQLTALRAGASELSQHFDWDMIARRTIAFYQSCL